MTQNRTKKLYVRISQAVAILAYIFLSDIELQNIAWFHFLIIIFIGWSVVIPARFLYTHFSGVLVHSVRFYGNANPEQKFIMEYQLGGSDRMSIQGVFINSYNLSENEIAQMIYETLTRKDFNPVHLSGETKIFNSNYRGMEFIYELSPENEDKGTIPNNLDH